MNTFEINNKSKDPKILTFLPKTLLFLKILRKYPIKKVPNINIVESRATLGVGIGASLPLASVLFVISA